MAARVVFAAVVIGLWLILLGHWWVGELVMFVVAGLACAVSASRRA